ncbi:MAG: DUF1289 domain-containing protein [Gammaproteobacteria bacterium HGW-Gammaproteobacteria-4]|jgi:hypothetical protein|nr:MAG: DUF1289 domain-containing protein [Gammaproteobacteria bacterium HGW-Gammaproteobacteria-4]
MAALAAIAPGQETVTSAVLSPCIGICELDATGYCVGCHRTGDEIAGWLGFHPQWRLHLMEQVLPSRERARTAQAAPVRNAG